jgi:hypothetical protein
MLDTMRGQKITRLICYVKLWEHIKNFEEQKETMLVRWPSPKKLNCAAVAYNPVHPKVQNAAGTLIECLTRKGDLCKAELFAQMTFDSLKDPQNGLDQQSEAVARGYYDITKVITDQRGDMVKAEMLARVISNQSCNQQQRSPCRKYRCSASKRRNCSSNLLLLILEIMDLMGPIMQLITSTSVSIIVS